MYKRLGPAKTKFSIIVALYNQIEYTQLFLESIRKNSTCSYEIVVIDNGSTDATKNWISTQNIDKLILWNENKGTTQAWNAGINAAKGEYLCVINNDLIVGPRWLEGLLQILDNAPSDLATLSPSTNGVTYSLDLPFNRECLTRFNQEATHLQSASPKLFSYSLIGSTIVVPRKTIDKIGVFDARFFCYYNDLDYCLSITAAGLKPYTTTLSTVYHFGGASAKNNTAINAKKEQDKIAFLSKWSQLKMFLDDFYRTIV